MGLFLEFPQLLRRYVKLLNRFPVQQPFEMVDDILNYVSVQLTIPGNSIYSYARRRETVAEHQERIREYLAGLSVKSRKPNNAKAFRGIGKNSINSRVSGDF